MAEEQNKDQELHFTRQEIIDIVWGLHWNEDNPAGLSSDQIYMVIQALTES